MTRPSRSLSRRQIMQAAAITLLGFLGSSALGLVRLFIVTQQFGTSETRDAFIAAQRLPELIFVLVSGGALASAFIPIYARQREQDERQAWNLASAVMTFSAAAAILMSVAAVFLAPWLVANVLFTGRSPELQALTVSLMRLMMLTPALFAIGGLTSGLLQSHGLFTLPALAISMNSVGLIVGALFLAPLIKVGGDVAQVGPNNIYGLAWGAVLSAILYLLVQLPGVWAMSKQGSLRPLLDRRVAGVTDVLRLMLPRMIGLAVVQVNFLVNIALAGTMIEGSLTALDTAWTLMFTALGVIAQSIGSAVFPSLAALHSENDLPGFKDRLNTAVRTVLFLAVPATVVFITFGTPLVQIFERGAWTPDSTAATAWALAFYATGIAGFALLEVLSRAFYARGDTMTPVIVGIAAMLSNIALSFVFVRVIGDPASLTQGAFAGLALANAVTTLAEAALLWWLMQRQIGVFFWRESVLTIAKTIIAAFMMGVVLTAIQAGRGDTGLLTLILGGVSGGLIFFGISAALNIPEARSVPAYFWRRIRR